MLSEGLQKLKEMIKPGKILVTVMYGFPYEEQWNTYICNKIDPHELERKIRKFYEEKKYQPDRGDILELIGGCEPLPEDDLFVDISEKYTKGIEIRTKKERIIIPYEGD